MTLIKLTRCCVAALLLLGGIFVATGKQKHVVKEDRAKAKYFFAKGSTSEAQGNYDKAYEYYKKAFNSDNSYTDAAFTLGQLRLMLTDTFDTEAEKARSLEMLKKHIDLYPNDEKSLQTYAYYAGVAGNMPEAIRVLSKILKDHPGKSEIYLQLASAYLEMDEVDNALKAMHDYEKIEGETYETLMQKVSLLVSKQDTIGVLNEVKNYRNNNNDTNEGVLTLANAFIAYEMNDSARNILEEALRINPHNGEVKSVLASYYVEEEKDTVKFHKLIRESFDDLYPDFEKQMGMLAGYSTFFSEPGTDYTECDALFRHALSRYSEDPTFLEIYANYEVQKGNYEKGYQIRKKALALDPENSSLLRGLIGLSLVVDKPEEGIKAFEVFPAQEELKDYDNVLPYITALQINGQDKKALSVTEKAIKDLAPNLSLADTITEAVMDKLFDMDLTFMDIYGLGALYEVAGDIYGKGGKSDNVERSYENALTLSYGYNSSALNNYAWYIVDTKKAEPGSDEFNRAKDMSYTSLGYSEGNPQAPYFDTYAWILFLDHDYKEALEYMEMAMALTEEEDYSAELFSHYGDILFMTGQPAEALEQWKKALEYEPDNKLLKKKIANKTFFYE